MTTTAIFLLAVTEYRRTQNKLQEEGLCGRTAPGHSTSWRAGTRRSAGQLVTLRLQSGNGKGWTLALIRISPSLSSVYTVAGPEAVVAGWLGPWRPKTIADRHRLESPVPQAVLPGTGFALAPPDSFPSPPLSSPPLPSSALPSPLLSESPNLGTQPESGDSATALRGYTYSSV